MRQVVKDIFIILQYREKRKLWLLALADTCISLLDIIFLIALLYVINFYIQPLHTIAAGHFSFNLFDKHPVLLITLFFLLFAVKNMAGFMISKMQYRFVYSVASRISRQNLDQYLTGRFYDYINTDSSVAHRRISQEPIEFAHYVLNGVQQLFSQLVLVMVTIAAVLIFNPLLFPLLLILLAPPVFWVSFLMKRRLDAASRQAKRTSEQTIQHLQEALTGFVESNIYRKHDFFIGRYLRFQERLNHYLSERLIIQNLPPRLIEAFAVFGLLILVLVNFFTEPGKSIPLVTIGALMVAAYKIIPGIVKITNTAGQVKTYAFAATDLAATTLLPGKRTCSNESIDSICFDNVCFSYPDAKIIRSLTFMIKRGDFAVVAGISGKGKTTLINLLLGFLTQDAGAVCVNGRQADAATRQGYWAGIAYVKQQNFMLHASIAENITLQEDGYDHEKIEEIAALTGVDAFTCLLPGGLHSIITENGKNFSGGQRQRINFARALYRNFDLLILDEPFSELDEQSELLMLRQLQKIAAQGKMVLLITHNKNALSFCNKKILMNEGE